MPLNLRSRFLLSFLQLAVLLSPGFAQVTVQGGTLEKGGSRAGSQQQNPSQIHVEFDMTPEEAAHLLGSVDEVIAFDSKVTGLPVRGHVERKMTSRDELKQLAAKRMQDSETAKKIQRSSAVLMKFGFIPRDFDVQQFAVETTVNELAGYYDPRAKTMYLLNWLPANTQLPVMAHELDHALQDQNFQLENWFKNDDPKANGPTGGDASEQQAARRAVAEGHATAVMIEYLLSKQGRSLAELPQLPAERIQAFADRIITMPATQRIPLVMREEMAFPYLYGFLFVQQVLLKAGKEQAYSGIFKRPPDSTRQILEPATYLAHEKLPPLPLPALAEALGKEYEKVESGSIGEFDCLTLLKQFNSRRAKEIATNWRGDYFYAARRTPGPEKAAGATMPPAGNLKPEDISLVFVSRWATPAAAHEFAAFYRGAISQRYSHAQPVMQSGSELPANLESWNTAEGKVTVEVRGNLVLDLESLDDNAVSRVEAAVLHDDKP